MITTTTNSSHDIALANMDGATPSLSRNDFVGALTITSGRDVSLSDRSDGGFLAEHGQRLGDSQGDISFF